MSQRHHGITAKEYTEGIRPISDISTAIIGMVCTSEDADAKAFPLNTPVFHASAYQALGKAGSKGTLAKSLDAIVDQPIKMPTNKRQTSSAPLKAGFIPG